VDYDAISKLVEDCYDKPKSSDTLKELCSILEDKFPRITVLDKYVTKCGHQFISKNNGIVYKLGLFNAIIEDSSDMLDVYAKNEETPKQLTNLVDLAPLVNAIKTKKRENIDVISYSDNVLTCDIKNTSYNYTGIIKGFIRRVEIKISTMMTNKDKVDDTMKTIFKVLKDEKIQENLISFVHITAPSNIEAVMNSHLFAMPKHADDKYVEAYAASNILMGPTFVKDMYEKKDIEKFLRNSLTRYTR